VPFLHGVRDIIVRNKTKKRLYQDPRKDTGLRSDVGRSKGNINKLFRETLRLENANSRIFRQDSKNECQDIVEVSNRSKRKKRSLTARLGAMDVGALTTLGTVAPTNR
jgi:hypothetical protein